MCLGKCMPPFILLCVYFCGLSPYKMTRAPRRLLTPWCNPSLLTPAYLHPRPRRRVRSLKDGHDLRMQ